MVVTDVSNLSVRELTVKGTHFQKENGDAQSAMERSIIFAKRLSQFMEEKEVSLDMETSPVERKVTYGKQDYSNICKVGPDGHVCGSQNYGPKE
ncbi:hypothetical protein [Acutalibacter intestini]|uniref:hypothetical protein n=1 Tax=Acutalibacter intestini TaxID=3093659 RepID=UPI002AC8C306|nr:hypothetical protein [Acutalibacter sp. M00204]